MSISRSKSEFYSKEREKDLISLKKSSISIKLLYESTYGKPIDIRLIPIFKLLKFNDHTSREFWNTAQVYGDIEPIWEVYLSMSAFNYLISIQFSLDIFGFIVDIMKGRFEIISVGEYFIEIKPFISTHIKFKSWILLEKSPSLRQILAIVYYDEGAQDMETSFNTLMQEFYSFGYQIEKINNWENPLISLVEIRDNIYYPRIIDSCNLDTNSLNTIDLKFADSNSRKNNFFASEYFFQDSMRDYTYQPLIKPNEREIHKVDE